jgi:hypothetical protein
VTTFTHKLSNLEQALACLALVLGLLGCSSNYSHTPLSHPHCDLGPLTLEPLDVRAIRYSIAAARVNPELRPQVDDSCPPRYVCVPMYVFLSVLKDLDGFMAWTSETYRGCQ